MLTISQWLIFVSITISCKAEQSESECECPAEEQDWFAEETLVGQYDANGVGTPEWGEFTHAVFSALIPGSLSDYSQIAGWHDMCWELCGMPKPFCHEKAAQLVYDYCYCVVGGSNVHCWLYSEVVEIGMKNTDPCDYQMSECICMSESGETSNVIKRYLEGIYERLPSHLKAPQTDRFVISESDEFNAEMGRDYILDVMTDSEARQTFIKFQALYANYKIEFGDMDDESKWESRNTNIHTKRQNEKDLQYCESSEAAKIGFITNTNVGSNNAEISEGFFYVALICFVIVLISVVFVIGMACHRLIMLYAKNQTVSLTYERVKVYDSQCSD